MFKLVITLTNYYTKNNGFSLTEAIQQTPRCVNGFGSTDTIILNAETSSVNHMETNDLLLNDTPYDKAVNIKLKNQGDHPLLGLILEEFEDRIFL